MKDLVSPEMFAVQKVIIGALFDNYNDYYFINWDSFVGDCRIDDTCKTIPYVDVGNRFGNDILNRLSSYSL